MGHLFFLHRDIRKRRVPQTSLFYENKVSVRTEAFVARKPFIAMLAGYLHSSMKFILCREENSPQSILFRMHRVELMNMFKLCFCP